MQKATFLIITLFFPITKALPEFFCWSIGSHEGLQRRRKRLHRSRSRYRPHCIRGRCRRILVRCAGRRVLHHANRAGHRPFGIDQASSSLEVVGNILGVAIAAAPVRLTYVNVSVATTAWGTPMDLSQMVISYSDSHGIRNPSLLTNMGGMNACLS